MSQTEKTALELGMFSCLSDNYGYLIHDPKSSETVAVDTPAETAILQHLSDRGWELTQIWNTHWHPDHAGANQALKEKTGCYIRGPEEVRTRLSAPLDEIMTGGDRFSLGEYQIEVMAVPGHTLGHIAYHIPDAQMVFVGDSLFSMGCGRMFEGDPDMFWASLERLRALPNDTKIYCAHEYTQANLDFALSVDGDNTSLKEHGEWVHKMRSTGAPTIPTTIMLEKSINPFLRAAEPDMQKRMGREGSPVQTFAALRKLKDEF